MLDKYKVILWDFDGVLMDSNAVRDKGFEEVLIDYPKEKVDQLMQFHRKNGGLSRYVKFRYFFEEVLKTPVSDETINEFASRFSKIMKELLLDSALIIEDSLNFVKTNHEKYSMHIVSGSDQSELRYLCEKLNLSDYFISIHGSPTPKSKLVSDLLKEHDYRMEEVVLIGDSINDFEAAKINNIDFIGYNNYELKFHEHYLNSFHE